MEGHVFVERERMVAETEMKKKKISESYRWRWTDRRVGCLVEVATWSMGLTE
jgi:hypothetical protein